MADKYNIYIVNQSTTTQTFWCFLQQPEELEAQPGVFANSSAQLAVRSNAPGTNVFGIPVQYSVGAGASNKAVGLSVVVTSNVSADASLQETWDATYATVPPPMGPLLELDSVASSPGTISIVTGEFDQAKNEAAKWFSNQSFGIQTDSGYIGMTWAPTPQTTATLSPKLAFYISTGVFGSNQLAAWTTVSNRAQRVTESSFLNGDCTVTLKSDGNWKVTSGVPPQEQMKTLIYDNLDWLLSDEHQKLVAIAYLNKGELQTDTIESVSWASGLPSAGPQTFLSGKLTVSTALTAAFGSFILSGIQFQLSGDGKGLTSVSFSYSGEKSAQFIKGLFQAGKSVIFGDKKLPPSD